jgi:hypothetical protein
MNTTFMTGLFVGRCDDATEKDRYLAAIKHRGGSLCIGCGGNLPSKPKRKLTIRSFSEDHRAVVKGLLCNDCDNDDAKALQSAMAHIQKQPDRSCRDQAPLTVNNGGGK